MRRRDDFNEHLYLDRFIGLLQVENMKKTSTRIVCSYSKARSREPAFAAGKIKSMLRKKHDSQLPVQLTSISNFTQKIIPQTKWLL